MYPLSYVNLSRAESSELEASVYVFANFLYHLYLNMLFALVCIPLQLYNVSENVGSQTSQTKWLPNTSNRWFLFFLFLCVPTSATRLKLPLKQRSGKGPL